MTTSAANGNNALDTHVVHDEDEHGARARRRQARTSKDEVAKAGRRGSKVAEPALWPQVY